MSDELYQCPVCELHYTSPEVAARCEAFCRKYNACSLEITKFSIEAEQQAGSGDNA